MDMSKSSSSSDFGFSFFTPVGIRIIEGFFLGSVDGPDMGSGNDQHAGWALGIGAARSATERKNARTMKNNW